MLSHTHFILVHIGSHTFSPGQPSLSQIQNVIYLYLNNSLLISFSFMLFFFPFLCLHIFKLLSQNLSPSVISSLFPLPLLPRFPLTVKVTLIKSSLRTELLIALWHSSWFQIQIKAYCLLFSPLRSSPSSSLFHNVKYSLSLSYVDVHNLTSAPLPSRTEGQGEEQSMNFIHS